MKDIKLRKKTAISVSVGPQFEAFRCELSPLMGMKETHFCVEVTPIDS